MSLPDQEDAALPTTEPPTPAQPVGAAVAQILRSNRTETKKSGAVSKRVHLMFWSLGFGLVTLPLIVLLGAGAEASKVVQEQLLVNW